MADLIERDALVSLWKPLADRDCFAGNVIASCLNELNAQPTIDAEPVRHGHWIEYGDVQVCSECGEEHTWDEYRASFCENCGAKMDEEVEHEAD